MTDHATLLAETIRFRSQERATQFATVARSIEWTVEAREGKPMRLVAVSFNHAGKALIHRGWDVANVGEAYTRISEWVRELQLKQSIHSIITKRIPA